MHRTSLNDRYIKGTVMFSQTGDETAQLACFKRNISGTVPPNAVYDLEGHKWRVVQLNPSLYNDLVVILELERVPD